MGFSDVFGGQEGGGSMFSTQKNDGCMPSLTYQQRMWGFGFCFAAGSLCSFLAALSWIPGKNSALHDPTKFAIPYSLGNIVAILSTGFLWGFKGQCKKMWHPVRRIASGVYLLFLFATLIVSFTMKGNGVFYIVIILVIIQALALIWYCASYIPFGRTMIKSICGKCCSLGA